MRPSEVKAVVAVLDQEHGSAVDAAKAAIRALDESRRNLRQLCIIRQESDHLWVVVGPYSESGKRTDLTKALLAGLGGPRHAIGYLLTPEALEARREATETVLETHHCAACGHPKVAHIDRRWKDQAGTWRQPGCMCCDCKEKP